MARKSIIYSHAIDQNGRGLPVEVEHGAPPSGVSAATLDPIIAKLVHTADQGVEMLGRYTPMLHGLLQQLEVRLVELFEGEERAVLPVVLDLAEKTSRILESVSKMMGATVKAKDQAIRLQQNLVGSPVDFETMSEVDLRKIIAKAASGFADAAQP